MSLIENSSMGPADMAAVMRGGNGFGSYGDGGFFWIIILFLFAIFGNNGWGNNGSSNGNGAISYDVQRVVDQQSTANGISNLQAQISNGFSNAEVSRCNMQTNILQTLSQNQAATAAGFTGVNSGLADLKYTVATENCADRTQANENTRDIMENCNSNYQKLMDKMCQLELDGIKQNYEAQLRSQAQQISAMQTENQTLRFNASQGAQTSALLADNAAQTVALEQYLNPTPKPAYIVQNPNCCSQPTYSYGCCGNRMIG